MASKVTTRSDNEYTSSLRLKRNRNHVTTDDRVVYLLLFAAYLFVLQRRSLADCSVIRRRWTNKVRHVAKYK